MPLITIQSKPLRSSVKCFLPGAQALVWKFPAAQLPACFLSAPLSQMDLQRMCAEDRHPLPRGVWVKICHLASLTAACGTPFEAHYYYVNGS